VARQFSSERRDTVVKVKVKTRLEELAEDFVRRLRAAKDHRGGDMIPEEDYWHRGPKEWDEGIKVALLTLLETVRADTMRDHRPA
jgi:hypothetical protein